ncbi:MAG: hypothetical protein HC773_28105, partial [Scytonema sp. CRU_2_7]|nr:hypothetical protein [Scytonema sp. CRU_2_7]
MNILILAYRLGANILLLTLFTLYLTGQEKVRATPSQGKEVNFAQNTKVNKSFVPSNKQTVTQAVRIERKISTSSSNLIAQNTEEDMYTEEPENITCPSPP